MHNERDETTSRRGSAPPRNAEEIYSDWLKRPRSTISPKKDVVPDPQAKSELEQYPE